MSRSRRLIQMPPVRGLALLASVAAGPAVVHAMGSDSTPQAAAKGDPDYAAGRQAIDDRDWAAAVERLAKAEDHLKALDRICTFGRKEYSELKDRVAAFKAKSTS